MSYNKNYENNYEHDINNPAILQCLVDKVFFLIHLISFFFLQDLATQKSSRRELAFRYKIRAQRASPLARIGAITELLCLSLFPWTNAICSLFSQVGRS